LRDVILTLNSDSQIARMTAEQSLERIPPQKVMRLPEGSWGKYGDHSVWLNDQTRWMWEVEYRAESHLSMLVRILPWRHNTAVAECLKRAARELMLLQASDWPFVVSGGGAVDYGTQRHCLHAVRFQRACDAAEQAAHGAVADPVQLAQMAEIDVHDGGIFGDIDLAWWVS
jgi:1,4-alpha-glucan branching enzyme